MKTSQPKELLIAALASVTVWNLESLNSELPVFSHWIVAECWDSWELGWKHGIKFHGVEQCLKIDVLAEREVFKRHITVYFLKIFETRVKNETQANFLSTVVILNSWLDQSDQSITGYLEKKKEVCCLRKNIPLT